MRRIITVLLHLVAAILILCGALIMGIFAAMIAGGILEHLLNIPPEHESPLWLYVVSITLGLIVSIATARRFVRYYTDAASDSDGENDTDMSDDYDGTYAYDSSDGIDNSRDAVSTVINTVKSYGEAIYSRIEAKDAVYLAKAEEEINNDYVNDAMWSQALVKAKGNETQRKVEYMKLRARQLKR